MQIHDKTFSIRWKIVLIVLAAVVALVSLVYIFSETIISKSYLQIEKDAILKNIDRVDDSVKNISAELTTKLTDWAYWDDTYNYVIDKNREYEESNLNNIALFSLNINAIAFVDSSGKVIYAKVIDLDTMSEVPNDSLVEHIQSHPILTSHTDDSSFVEGIVSTPEGPMFLSSRPILRTTREGPIRGSLIFAKYINSQTVDSIGRLTHLSIKFYDFKQTSVPAHVSQAKSVLVAGGQDAYTTPLSEELVAGFKILKDIYNQPVFIIKIEEPRYIFAQGKSTLFYFIGITVVLLVLFGCTLIFLLEKFIVSRLFKLSREVRHIGKTNSFKERVTENQKDEIWVLQSSINKMLDALLMSQNAEEESNQQLKIEDEQLSQKITELERVNKLMIDRELKMIELKDEIKKLRNDKLQ